LEHRPLKQKEKKDARNPGKYKDKQQDHIFV